MGVIMKVRAEIEVAVGTWGNDCTFLQIAEQVRRDGVNIVKDKLGSVGRVIGTPRVVAILVFEDATKGGSQCQS